MTAPTMYVNTLLTLMLTLKRWTTCPCGACHGLCGCSRNAFCGCAFFEARRQTALVHGGAKCGAGSADKQSAEKGQGRAEEGHSSVVGCKRQYRDDRVQHGRNTATVAAALALALPDHFGNQLLRLERPSVVDKDNPVFRGGSRHRSRRFCSKLRNGCPLLHFDGVLVALRQRGEVWIEGSEQEGSGWKEGHTSSVLSTTVIDDILLHSGE